LEVRSGDEVEELAQRFTEMQAALKRLQQLALQDRELEIAASIQRNLLRKPVPLISGAQVVPVQRQANLVGGDWYDVDLVGHELSVVVGDASGKGIAAALMSTIALSFLRAERGLGSDPRRVIARTNDALLDATDPDSFTTLIYAGLNLHTGELRWLNMGHPAPFCIRHNAKDPPDPRGAYLEGPRNRALGWFQDPGLAQGVTTLFPGDRVIFFTDGWLDAKSSHGEVFGENRFAEALLRFAPAGTENMQASLVDEVDRWAAGKLDDDLTMLVVEFEGSPVVGGVPERQSGEEEWHSRR
jgi:phosphoserine phosphatase RsbU/P